jgi:hypothetical protein
MSDKYELITPAERNRLCEDQLRAELGYWRVRKQLWETYREFEVIFGVTADNVQQLSVEVRALRDVFIEKLRS